MAKMAKAGFSSTAMERTQYLTKNPHAEVLEEQTWGAEYSGQENRKAAIESNLAMIHQNHTNRCLPSHNSTAKDLQTH